MKFRQLSAVGASALSIYEFHCDQQQMKATFGVAPSDVGGVTLVNPNSAAVDFDQFLLLKVRDGLFEGHFHGGLGVNRALKQFLHQKQWREEAAELPAVSTMSSPLAMRMLLNDDNVTKLKKQWRRRLMTPPRIALVGPPNAGKSTLFNAWLREHRVTVCDLHGTTRDFVETNILIGDDEDAMAIRLVDTAGFWNGAESEADLAATAMSKRQLASCDERLWILDAAHSLDPMVAELMSCPQYADDLIFINRLDLAPKPIPVDHRAPQAIHLNFESNVEKVVAIEKALFEKWGGLCHD